MYKKIITLVSVVLLTSCGGHSENSSSQNSQSSSNDVISSTTGESSNTTSSSTTVSTSTSSTTSSTTTSSSSTTSESTSSSSITSSSVTTSSSTTTSSNNNGTNPDGSAHLDVPGNINDKFDISEWQNYDIAVKDDSTKGYYNQMPEYFGYIYGNQIVDTPDYYADDYGGVVMEIKDYNEMSRGIQTGMFESWVKVELRINFGDFHANSKAQHKDRPVFTIYGFSQEGELVTTEEIEDIDTTPGGNVRTYLRNENMSYIEIRATNLPKKSSSQSYNFGITGISLKGWQWE